MIEIEIANHQSELRLDEQRIADAARRVLLGESIHEANISIAVVDDDTIHQLNRRYLDHDYATDVLSFRFDSCDDEPLSGEIVTSADTAVANAARYGLTTADELLLYVVHGTLHLVGYDDRTPEQREQMRLRERRYLAHFEIEPHFDIQPQHDGQHLRSAGGLNRSAVAPGEGGTA